MNVGRQPRLCDQGLSDCWLQSRIKNAMPQKDVPLRLFAHLEVTCCKIISISARKSYQTRFKLELLYLTVIKVIMSHGNPCRLRFLLHYPKLRDLTSLSCLDGRVYAHSLSGSSRGTACPGSAVPKLLPGRTGIARTPAYASQTSSAAKQRIFCFEVFFKDWKGFLRVCSGNMALLGFSTSIFFSYFCYSWQ